MSEIANSSLLPATAPAVQAHSDDQLLEIWLHGRSSHTQRAYRADIERFRRGQGSRSLRYPSPIFRTLPIRSAIWLPPAATAPSPP